MADEDVPEAVSLQPSDRATAKNNQEQRTQVPVTLITGESINSFIYAVPVTLHDDGIR